MKRIALLALLLTLSAHLPADEVPLNHRPSAELEPLIDETLIVDEPSPETPQAPRASQTETTLELRDDLIALLPDEDERTRCREASVWQAAIRLTLEPSPEQLATIVSCSEDIQSRLDALEGALHVLGVESAGDAQHLWPKPAEVKKDLAAAAMVLDVEQDCTGFATWTDQRAVKCAELLRRKAARTQQILEQHKQRVEAGQATVDVPAAAPDGEGVTEAPRDTSGPATVLPRSWESIVINALADQMVVQLKGVAAQKLLGVFGDALCRTHGRVDVASYFPETCALLLPPGDPTINIRLQITQLPAEFQRTLRNDLVALLPAVLNMSAESDRVAYYLVPLFNALRNGDEPLNALAAFKCPPMPADKTDDDARICSMVTFAARMAELHDDPDWATKLKTDAAFTTWITQFAITESDALTELESLRTSLENALAAYKNTKKEKLDKARVAIAFTESILTVAVRLSKEGDASEIQRLARYLAATQRANTALTRWGSVGRAIVRVAEDFRRGYDPLTLSERAAIGTDCVTVEDVGCVVKITGITINAFRELAATQEIKEKLENVDLDQSELALQIADALKTRISENTLLTVSPLREVWEGGAKTRIVTLTRQAAPSLIDIHRGVLESRRLAGLTDITPAARDEALNKVYTNMVESTFEIWRITTGLSVPNEDRERVQRLVNNARTCWVAVKERNYLTLAGTMYSLSLDLGIGKPLPQRAEQYRLLLTNLASAGDEQAFKNAVDTYLSQSAASIKKFDHPASITLTGLPGLALAQLQNTGTNGSLFAPVGVDFFVRNRIPFFRRQVPLSLGVFVSLIDLGNLVATKYENDDDEADVEQSSRFRDVFAPGAYIRFPLRQSGFSVGAGWARVPVVAEGSDERNYASKISAFVAYDLSWFTFWRRD